MHFEGFSEIAFAEILPELLASGCLGRFSFQEVVSQHSGQQGGVDRSAGRHFPVSIITFSALCDQLDKSVDDHIAGAGIECDDVFRYGGGGQIGDIGDAADVLNGTFHFFVGKEDIVGEGHQRGSLAACGHIARAKIRYGCDPGLLSDDGRFSDLQGRADQSAAEFFSVRIVIDRLAVGAD